MKHGLPDANLSYTDWCCLIDEWIFSEMARGMLKRHLLDGITFEKVAEEFGRSTQHTKTIIYKAEKELFRHLK